MPIYSYLDLSTAHVTQAERDALAEGFADIDGAVPIVREHPYGWWIHVVDDVDELCEDFTRRYPAAALLVSYARRHDCNWINLDADAQVHPNLPTYGD